MRFFFSRGPKSFAESVEEWDGNSYTNNRIKDRWTDRWKADALLSPKDDRGNTADFDMGKPVMTEAKCEKLEARMIFGQQMAAKHHLDSASLCRLWSENMRHDAFHNSKVRDRDFPICALCK